MKIINDILWMTSVVVLIMISAMLFCYVIVNAIGDDKMKDDEVKDIVKELLLRILIFVLSGLLLVFIGYTLGRYR